MPLDLGNSSLPFLNFNVQTDTWSVAGDGGKRTIDIVGKPLCLDPEHVVRGWLTLQSGTREWIPIPLKGILPKPPNDQAKVGVSLLVYAPEVFGDGRIYENCHHSEAWKGFVKKLFAKSEPHFGRGEVPIVTITGTESVRRGAGTSRDIHFTIDKWVPRPQPLIDAVAERDANGAADYTSAKAGRPVIVSSGKKTAFQDIDDDIPF